MSPPLRHAPALRWRWLVPVVAVVLAFHFSPFGAALDRVVYDFESRHPLRRPPVPPDSVLLLIDEHTMAKASELGMRWPFQRHVFAGLIAALDRAGAKKIMFDFVFLEESDRAEFDQLLASVAAATPTLVLGRTKERNPVFWNASFVSAHPEFFRRPRAGLVDFLPDDDGVVRRYSPSGSLAALAFDAPPVAADGLLRWHGGLSALRQNPNVRVHSAADWLEPALIAIKHISDAAPEITPEQFARMLAAEPRLTGRPIVETVRDRIVFVGASAAGTFDVKPTPAGKLEPGTLIHWTAWANLATRGFITPLPRMFAVAVAALAMLLLIVAAARWPGIKAAACLAIALCVVLLAAAYAGLSANWFFPPATPIAAATLALLGVAMESFWTERRRKQEIQSMFGSYVDPGVVELLVRDPQAIRLGGERRTATVYFSDLAGFTDLSEKIRPEELVDIINLYLEEMSDCLMSYGAYVDKYIGDAVMAVFGAPQPRPDHALAACHAALAARDVLARINARLAATTTHTLRMRIGINTGEMIVGNVGSERKRNYTVLGDAVNLASRLEAANKEFGTDILLGENTAQAIGDRLATRPLTRLRVKGKLHAVEVHELVGALDQLAPGQREFLAAYREGYACYAAREFTAAAGSFARAATFASHDRVTAELLRSARQFAQTPPPDDWEPLLILETK